MFITKINAVKSITDDFWYNPVGSVTGSGVPVTPSSAVSAPAVFACIQVLSQSIAQIPFEIVKEDGDVRSKAKKHPLYRLLSLAPNYSMTSYNWRLMMVIHLCMYGNSYNRILYNARGEIDELIPIHPMSVEIETYSIGESIRKRFIVKNASGNKKEYLQHEMMHVIGWSDNGIFGLSPLEIQREAIGMSLAAQDYGARFYQNDTRPPGWIEYPGKFKDQEQKSNFSHSWNATQGGNNRGSTAVLESGMKYHEIGISNDDAQYIETRKFNVEDIARIFKIPPHKIQHLEKSSFNNIEWQGREFVNDTLTPWLVNISQSVSRDLIMEDDIYFPSFNTESLLLGDTKSRFEAYGIGITNSIMSPNDARIKEGWNPKPGLDSHQQQLNMQQVGEREKKLAKNAAKVVARKEFSIIKAGLQKENSAVLINEFLNTHADYVSNMLDVDIIGANNYVKEITEELMNNDIKTLLVNWESNKTEKLCNI